jgi:hypothetical protein
MPSPYFNNYGKVTVDTATVTITDDGYVGQRIVFARAEGVTATLPKATGSGNRYEFIVGVTLTGNGIIKVADAVDIIQGVAHVSASALASFQASGTHDTITMNGTTTGGLIGSRVVLDDIAPGIWATHVIALGSGTAATPFSATVS